MNIDVRNIKGNVLKNMNILLKQGFSSTAKATRFAIVHHSNSIEGSTLTKEETYLLLDEKLTPSNKPLEHTFMALDHLEALKYVLDLSSKKEKLSVDIVKNISALVMKNTGSLISSMGGDFDSSKGEFRKVTVRAGTRAFMDYKKVPDRVQLLINEINTNIDKSKDFVETNNLAFDAHYQMVTIHPFADGNGRLSRLLMNYVQSYHNHPLSVVFKEDKSKYFAALEGTRENGDTKVFRSFMYEQLKKHLMQEISVLSKGMTNKKSFDTGLSLLL